MIENDTIRLLRECDAGIKMGVSSIGEVMEYVRSSVFGKYLTDCADEHKRLEHEMQSLLNRFHDEGKEPSPVAKGMSWIKTSVKLAVDGSDETVADLITDGCKMGVKSLSKYLNQSVRLPTKNQRISPRGS